MTPTEALKAECAALMIAPNKGLIAAIKHVRAVLRLPLEEARDWVMALPPPDAAARPGPAVTPAMVDAALDAHQGHQFWRTGGRAALMRENMHRSLAAALAVSGSNPSIDTKRAVQSGDSAQFAQRNFVNEVGNEIFIEVSLGLPGCLCRFSLAGPDSSAESYTTRMELEYLRDALIEVLPPKQTTLAVSGYGEVVAVHADLTAEIKSIIADADVGPPTDVALCIECGSWTPWRHPYAHEHEDGCTAPARYLARRDWKTRLRAVCASIKGTAALTKVEGTTAPQVTPPWQAEVVEALAGCVKAHETGRYEPAHIAYEVACAALARAKSEGLS